MHDIIKIDPYNFEPYRFKVGRVNYPDLVASYDTRPGNEVGLFYNAFLRSPHGLVRPFVWGFCWGTQNFRPNLIAFSRRIHELASGSAIADKTRDASRFLYVQRDIYLSSVVGRPICLADENRNTFIIRSEAIIGSQLSYVDVYLKWSCIRSRFYRNTAVDAVCCDTTSYSISNLKGKIWRRPIGNLR